MKQYLGCLVVIALIASLLTLFHQGEARIKTEPADQVVAVEETKPEPKEEKVEKVKKAKPEAKKPVEKPVESVEKPPEPVATGGCELVYNYTNWDQRVAYAVCMAESRGDTYAANLTDNHGSCRGSFGLMQLACFWIPDPYNAVSNIAKANEIYARSGWGPWGAYTSGKYLRFLQ